MSLLIDKKHKNANISGINSRKKFTLGIASIGASIMLLTGCGAKTEEEYEKIAENVNTTISTTLEDVRNEVTTTSTILSESSSNTLEKSEDQKSEEPQSEQEIIESCKKILETSYSVQIEGKKITDFESLDMAEIKKISTMRVRVSDDMDLSILNNFTGLEHLGLTQEKAPKAIKHLNSLDGNKLKKIKSLDISESLASNADISYSKNDFDFLKSFENLESLRYTEYQNSYVVNPEIFYNLKNLKNFRSLELNLTNDSNIDFKKLSFLKELKFDGNAYDMAQKLTTEEIKYLQDEGVNIEIDSAQGATLNKILEINKRLDEIVKSFNLSPNATDTEKLDNILAYTLENLQYDPKIAELTAAGSDSWNETKKFGINGALYPVFEMDTQICTNYAAIVDALSKRMGVESHVLAAPDHEFNLMKIEDEYYYVDSTWLDQETIAVETTEEHKIEDLGIPELNEEFKNAEVVSYSTKSQIYNGEEVFKAEDESLKDKLTWRKFDPSDLKEQDERTVYYHTSYNIPENINFNSIEKEQEQKSKENNKEDSKEENKDANTIDESSSEKDNRNEGGLEKVDTKTENKKFNIVAKGKKYVIPAAALVGIMSALGAAKIVSKNKKRNREQSIAKTYYPKNGFNDCYSDRNSTYSGMRDSKNIYSRTYENDRYKGGR